MMLTEEKTDLRRRMQGVRRAAGETPGLGARLAARAAEILPDLAQGRVLAGYMPMRGEADPLPAMAAHRGTVCVPVIVARGAPLHFRAWTPDAAMVAGTASSRSHGGNLPPQALKSQSVTATSPVSRCLTKIGP